MVYIAAALLFVSICFFVFSFFANESALVRLISIGLLAGSMVIGCIASVVTVDAGHVGVPVLFGSVQKQTLQEGLHIVNPFLSVDQFSIQTKTLTMSGEEALHAMSSDQLSMQLDVSVLFHLNEKHAYGIRRLMPDYENSVVVPSARTAIREAVREYDAVAAVSTSRDELSDEMADLVVKRIKNALTKRKLSGESIEIDDVQLRNIQLPGEIQESIRNVQRERQKANQRQQAIQTATQEAERIRIEAEGRKSVALIEAARDAETRLIRATAEAKANMIVSKSLTRDLLKLKAIKATQDITSNNKTRTVILGSGDKQTPLIMNMGQND